MRNLAVLILLCGLVLLATSLLRDLAPDLLTRESVPQKDAQPLDFTYRLLDGSEHRLADHAGRPVLLHFWATWCPPCIRELPELIDKAQTMPEVDLLLISVDRDQAALRRFLQPYEKQLKSANIFTVHDAGLAISSGALEITMFPETLLLNRSLVPVRYWRGPVRWNRFDYLRFI